MLATQRGMKVDRLVLLSCPVHWGHYQPNFHLVGKAYSIRVFFDLVIWTDRQHARFAGGTSLAAQRFPLSVTAGGYPKIREIILPIWFGKHSDSHEPSVWAQHKITV